MPAILGAIAAALIALTISVKALGGEYWLVDLVTFFWPVAALLAVVLFLSTLLVPSKAARLLAILAVAVTLYPIFSLPPAPDATAGNRLRVLTANLLNENRDTASFVALLTREQPDIVVTQETRNLFVEAIRGSGLYPFESTGTVSANDDKKVFSRYPIREQARISDAPGTPVLRRHPMRLVIDGPDGPIVLYAIHPDTSRSLRQWHSRNAYLDLLANAVRREADNAAVIVAGDWNVPAYSVFFDRFFEKTGYRFARPGWYLPVTRFWTRAKSFVYFGSTIDHVAVSPQLRVTDWRRGRDIGSNHLPVIVDIAMPAGNAVARN
ncbi:endonuclease/exonuclease/phosphatase family protein [Rhizobium sp. TH2]|uniref:endonuclease/exonuclease/phosphatase family protein n=1 Tax=Rhizobium sp. TH2 TaxID=2775403 RepID=UPI002157E622|nr:endonuclease/exonuclease/phosphatase family protein [Rhizobium sp. TH2]UVC08049.1 endonuclease/exonuclease/phosphatase family protein [Rhizobium sp. TH2]